MIEGCCAFTGHRPRKFPWGYDESDTRYLALKKALAEQIAKLVDAGYTDLLSGMAEGVDTWTALAVLVLKEENPALKLHCVLPCKEQVEQWSSSARKLYFSILEQADSLVYVSQEYSKDCMLKRNHYLVDHAACLLAVYNGIDNLVRNQEGIDNSVPIQIQNRVLQRIASLIGYYIPKFIKNRRLFARGKSKTSVLVQFQREGHITSLGCKGLV